MELNQRPIIGIISQTLLKDPHDNTPIPNIAEVKASYVKWIEAAGARVVPVLINQPEEYYEKLYNSLNGVLLPGGLQKEETVLESPTGKVSKYFQDRSIEEFDKTGDYFPIWGTCQGFDILSLVTAKKFVMEKSSGTHQVKFPLKLEQGYHESRLFGPANMPSDILTILTTESVTYNQHFWNIPRKTFSNNEYLKKFYRILSTYCDAAGVEFVTTIEAYRYPIYATSWHPEDNSFTWNSDEDIPHSYNAIKAVQHMANFFVNEARKNQHKFNSLEEETKNLIYNYTPINRNKIYDGNQYYYFDI